MDIFQKFEVSMTHKQLSSLSKASKEELLLVEAKVQHFDERHGEEAAAGAPEDLVVDVLVVLLVVGVCVVAWQRPSQAGAARGAGNPRNAIRASP